MLNSAGLSSLLQDPGRSLEGRGGMILSMTGSGLASAGGGLDISFFTGTAIGFVGCVGLFFNNALNNASSL